MLSEEALLYIKGNPEILHDIRALRKAGASEERIKATIEEYVKRDSEYNSRPEVIAGKKRAAEIMQEIRMRQARNEIKRQIPFFLRGNTFALIQGCLLLIAIGAVLKLMVQACLN
jgi:hypothetical protein